MLDAACGDTCQGGGPSILLSATDLAAVTTAAALLETATRPLLSFDVDVTATAVTMAANVTNDAVTILPLTSTAGLLLSFVSRFDKSTRLMCMMLDGSGRPVANVACPESLRCFICAWCACCVGNGYFGPVMVAYAIGLGMANMAVYVMEMGQVKH